MNPGQLKDRLTFYEVIFDNGEEQLVERCKLWGQVKFKKNKFTDQQPEKSYQIIIRANKAIKPLMKALCQGKWYDIMAVDEGEPGYFILDCILGYVHNLNDRCTVSRLQEVELASGETIHQPVVVMDQVPCELVKIDSGDTLQTDTTHNIRLFYKIHMETHRNIKIGDKIEVAHRGETLRFTVKECFKYHTFQEVIAEMEGEA
ncbi:head-tail adaptor protein [Geobacillus stearothermophilus]|uniref:phage head completion protein n=1 Tax=Geobacillus stearothermophilus TaxID=1422 RepID=UPI002E1A34CE|nr:head-tail adaptor protein [Geobacillus stearothermophilus]MED4830631.1 head-tail adaptor protein [Geobacillus stearothermophilus]MED4960323.1 head-tail adaptor protein [Geobacillus stearothermophilus]